MVLENDLILEKESLLHLKLCLLKMISGVQAKNKYESEALINKGKECFAFIFHFDVKF